MGSYQLDSAQRDLATGITGDAEVFGFSPEKLAWRLTSVAERYRSAIIAHQKSSTRGELLKKLAHVEAGGDDDFARRISALEGQALDTVLGAAPSGGLKLFGRDEPENRDILVPGIEQLEVAAIKKMFAAQARGKVEGDIAAERQRTGFDFIRGRDWNEKSGKLRKTAESQPALARRLLGEVIGTIRKTFRLGANNAGGLNQKVIAGLDQPSDWQLIIGVLDQIWPVEKGEMPSAMRTHARQIIDQVIIFARGETAAVGRKPDRDHLFAETWFSSILTWRHQINTLTESLVYLDRRLLPLHEQFDRPPEMSRKINLLEAKVYYPILHWKREIERRLEEADYRSGDESVRRVTGDYLGFPDVPAVSRDLPQPATVVRLVRALRSYKGKKVPPNKGKRKTTASATGNSKKRNSSFKNI